ncbi:nuclear transport factor 2 family protein [Pedobacter sp. BMA]|uniref:nuclear transport factor 2 family protein n=1 Tax=Pedobacter sp. BMA TaxID=1663685 RepID=UPI000ABC4859|nr:nuclear transport factor 2 family protein [Pedobacter sp. BMA]
MKINQAIFACTLIVTCLSVSRGFAQARSKDVSVSETRKNKKADDEFLRALQTGDVSNLNDVAAPDFVNHGVGNKIGPDSLKSSIRSFHSRFKPSKVEVVSRTTDGEYFGNWVSFIGSNPKMIIDGIEMTRYSNGKAIEHWFFPNNQRPEH